jgi:hypothetical protein
MEKAHVMLALLVPEAREWTFSDSTRLMISYVDERKVRGDIPMDMVLTSNLNEMLLRYFDRDHPQLRHIK